MEILKLVASYAGYVITICSLISLAYGPLRSKILNSFLDKQKNEKQDQEIKDINDKIANIKSTVDNNQAAIECLKEALQCSIRNTITMMYYKYTAQGSIPMFEKDNLGYLQGVYIKLGGNSYIKDCYKELMDLPLSDR